MPILKSELLPHHFNCSQPDTCNRPRTIYQLIHVVGLEIILMSKSYMMWKPFTLAKYKKEHPYISDFTGTESALVKMVEDGLLIYDGKTYSITNTFFEVFHRYVVGGISDGVDDKYRTISKNS